MVGPHGPLVAMGFHLVAPNFRGSTGYGEDFRRPNAGDPGGGDLLDVAQAVRWAVEAGIAAEGQVAAAGFRYGGYMALLALARLPDLWRCAVSLAGVADWEEAYQLADAAYRGSIEGLFAGRRELFRERSSMAHMENVRAPICVVHPQRSLRAPLRSVLKLAQRLEELGKPFKLHVTPQGDVITDRGALFEVYAYIALFLQQIWEKARGLHRRHRGGVRRRPRPFAMRQGRRIAAVCAAGDGPMRSLPRLRQSFLLFLLFCTNLLLVLNIYL